MKSFRKVEHEKHTDPGLAESGWQLYQDGFSFAPVYPLEAGAPQDGSLENRAP